MAFSNLSEHEKDAFFSLLDEYFSSRPHLLSGAGDAPGPNANATNNTSASMASSAASAAHRAFSANPEAASRFVSAGFKAAAPPKPAPARAPAASAESDELEPAPVSVRSRVAAASQLFSQAPPGGAPFRPSMPPKAPSPQPHSSGVSGLVTSRKFGDIDTTSTKNAFGSIRSSNANKNAPPAAPPVPAAFTPKKSSFAPPPIRRASTASSSPTPASPSPPPPPPPPPPPAAPEQEEEETYGEWAEAIYDYDSGEAGDLAIKENERILITERTSEDWWTGEVNGRTGLFPSAYVKLL